MMKPPAARVMAKSRSTNEREEESIYRMSSLSPVGAGPVIRTYNVPAPMPAGPAQLGISPKMHADSSQIQSIMNPVQGPRDVQVRAGIKPPDHAKSNIAAIKEMSCLNNTRKAAQQQQDANQASRGKVTRSNSVPRPALQRQSSDGGRDFVKENRMGAAAPVRQPRAEPKADDGLKYLHKKDFGRVPTYLLERKIENLDRQEAEFRAKEAALIPPGMRLLSEEERLQTLTVLQKNRQDLERALQSLPLRIETPGQIRRRDEIEQRIREVEEGLKAFSRPKVMVKL